MPDVRLLSNGQGCNGALCTNKEIMAVIREDEVKESYFKNCRVDLLNSLSKEIFQSRGGNWVSSQKCSPAIIIIGWRTSPLLSSYTGEYMAQYTWGEITLGTLKTL